MIMLLIVLNLFFSTMNAWSAGRSWPEAKCAGGIARFMAWMVAIMSAAGFTWSYLAIATQIAAHWVPAKYAEGIMAMGYLVIIFPVLGTGLAMTIQSWAYFWKERTLLNATAATWNTFAEVYNTIEAARAIPECFNIVEKIFNSDDDDNNGQAFIGMIVIAIVLLCLAGGALTTAIIICRTARHVVQEDIRRADEAHANKGNL